MTKIRIEVAYGRPEAQCIIAVDCDEGTSAIEAVRQSDIISRFPEIHLDSAELGIFGQRVAHHALLKAGDRVEIYRPLKIDPKQARKLRAQKDKR